MDCDRYCKKRSKDVLTSCLACQKKCTKCKVEQSWSEHRVLNKSRLCRIAGLFEAEGSRIRDAIQKKSCKTKTKSHLLKPVWAKNDTFGRRKGLLAEAPNLLKRFICAEYRCGLADG